MLLFSIAHPPMVPDFRKGPARVFLIHMLNNNIKAPAINPENASRVNTFIRKYYFNLCFNRVLGMSFFNESGQIFLNRLYNLY